MQFGHIIHTFVVLLIWGFVSLVAVDAQFTSLVTSSQCSQIGGLATDNTTGLLFYSCPTSGIYSVDPTTAISTLRVTISTFPNLCPSPKNLLYIPSTQNLYASCTSGGAPTVVKIQPHNGYTTTALAYITQCSIPSALQFHNRTSTLYAGCNGGAIISINSTGQVSTLLASSPCSPIVSMTIHELNNTLFATCNGGPLLIINLANPPSYIYIPVPPTFIFVTSNAVYSSGLGRMIIGLTNGVAYVDSYGNYTNIPALSGVLCSTLLYNDQSGSLFCGYQGVKVFTGVALNTVVTSIQCPTVVALAGPTLARQNGVFVACTSAQNNVSVLSTACPPGSIVSGTNCAYCPINFYCPFVDTLTAVPCPAGAYCPAACPSPIPCPPGSYCGQGTSTPTLCRSGTFCPTSNLSQPINCTGGYVCSGSGLQAPSGSCSASYYCPIGSTTQQQCAPGYYCPGPYLAAPIPCPPGSYCPLTAAVDPGFLCPGGTYCSTPALSTPGQLCPTGSFCVINSTTPTLCAAGSFSGPGSTQCIPCSPGFVIQNGTCSICQPGQIALNATQCVACPAGFYCLPGTPFGRQLPCLDAAFYCPLGSALPTLIPPGQLSVNASGLSLCPPGSECNSGIATPCPPGRYADSPGISQCQSCTPTTYTNTSGLTACGRCPVGTFTSTSGMSACSLCPTGQFTNQSGVSICSYCKEGSYSDTRGSTECLLCSPGQYQDRSGSTLCFDCSIGRYQSVEGQTSCFLCLHGEASVNISRSTDCISCPPLFFCPLDSALVHAIPCSSRSQYCPGNTSDPIQILSGWYSNNCSDLDACSTESECPPGSTCQGGLLSPCPVGHASNQTKQTSCPVCEPGTFSNSPGSIACTPCPPGQFASGSGASTCTLCPAGSFQDRAGQSASSSCRDGQVSQNATGSTQCIPCPPYFFCPPGSSLDNGPILCSSLAQYCPGNTSAAWVVPTGSYASACLDGQAACSNISVCPSGAACQYGILAACPPGQYNPIINASMCLDCLPGTYSPISGATACVACPAGYYASRLQSSSCASCSAGQYRGLSDNPNACISCPIGTYNTELNASRCVFCQEGESTLSTGSVSCVGCPPGRFSQTLKFNGSCQLCPIGRYSEKTSSITCLPCPAGHYTLNSTFGALSCIPCPIGFYTNETAWPTPSCVACQSGTQSTSTSASTGCSACDSGTANAYENSPCLDCTPGRYASDPTLCAPCRPGQYAPNPRSTQCVLCPPNYVTNSSGSAGCTACSDGTVANYDQTACIVTPCQPGEELAAHSSTICQPCRPSQFNAGISTQCQTCPTNTYAPGYGSSTCLDCSDSIGFSCLAGSAVIQSGYWGYLTFRLDNSNPFVYTTNGSSTQPPSGRGQIEARAVLCPTGYCLGGNTLQLSNPLTQTQLSSLLTQNNQQQPTNGNDYTLPFTWTDRDVNAQTPACGENRDPSPANILCGSCADGWQEWRGQCVSCPSLQLDIVFEYFFLSFLFVLFLFFLSQRARSDSKILMYFIQTTLFQLSGSGMDSLFGFLGFVNFDLFQTSGRSCPGPLNAYQNLALSACIPILFLSQLLCLMLGHVLLRRAWNHPILKSIRKVVETWTQQLEPIDAQKEGEDRTQHQLQLGDLGFPFYKYARTGLSILCFGYLQLSASAIAYLQCIDVGGTSVVFLAPGIQCQSDTYRRWLTPVLLLLTLACLFPLGLAAFLYRNRAKLQSDPVFQSRYGVLYENYRPDRYVWQVWVLLRQVVLIGVSTAFVTQYSSQHLGFVYFHLFVYGVQTWFRPNLRVVENQLESWSHMLLLIMMVLVLPVQPPFSETRRGLLSVLFFPFVVLVVFHVFALRLPFKYARLCVKQWRLEQRQEAESSALDSKMSQKRDAWNADLIAKNTGVSLSERAGAPSRSPPLMLVVEREERSVGHVPPFVGAEEEEIDLDEEHNRQHKRSYSHNPLQSVQWHVSSNRNSM